MKEKRSPYDYLKLVNEALKSLVELVKTRKLMTLLVSAALVSLGGNGYQAMNNHEKESQLRELVNGYRVIAEETPKRSPIKVPAPQKTIVEKTIVKEPVTIVKETDCETCKQMILDHINGDLH